MTVIKPWQRVDSHQIAHCRIFDLKESVSVDPRNAAERRFYYIESADWVNIVPLTENNEVVMIHQFRHGNEEITLEIPGGMVDPGEAPETSAVRECLEETGYQVDVSTVESLGVLAPNPALFANKLHTYVARGAKQVAEIANTSTEHTEVTLVPLSELPGYLQSGKIDHSLVVATLWRFLYQQLIAQRAC